MALEVFYMQDIRNALLAAEQAMSATATASDGNGEFSAGFLAGYRAALATLALAFGLGRQVDQVPTPNWGWLIESEANCRRR